MRSMPTVLSLFVLAPALQAFTFSLPYGFDLPIHSVEWPAAVEWSAQADDGTSSALDVDAVVTTMQSYYEGLDDFVATFEQRYTSGALGETSVSTGRVHVMLPGRMRWDYASPSQRFFISDGEDLWIYEPDPGQYYTQSLADSELPTALSFLMGQGDLARDFEIELVATSDDAATLELVPREDEGQYQKLRFVVSTDSGAVLETTIYDPVGNTNHFAFTDRAENVGYEAADFTFSPPAGAVRIEAPNP